MSVNELTRVGQKVAATHCYRVGSHQVSSVLRDDFVTICNGLTLWAGILLDHSLMLGDEPQVRKARDGRITSMLPFCGYTDVDLTPILTYLDECDASLLQACASSDPFKGGSFLRRIKASPPQGCEGLVSLLSRTIKLCVRGEVEVLEAVRLCHESLCFLKKLEISRPDLEEAAYAAFLEFEADLARRAPLRSNPECAEVLDRMNALAREHLNGFTLASFIPKHGPGAVADPDCKCWYDKYHTMRVDDRIGYLLSKEGLGSQADYNPFVRAEKSTRTSRFVCVPKSWKKLRGISAEPVELQFYQQALFASIDRWFRQHSWWKQRVDLHDQPKSGKLAKLGSLTETYGTIDLSAASDSVTLELVKEVFKGTQLLYWLLGTRSVHTLCGDTKVRISKFAPMGSACCFPVECIIFTLAAQVASDRTRTVLDNDRETVRVFGDDIIVDWYACDECIRILEMLGFSVNTEKSFIKGKFREACGVEAYLGHEIQPLRYKRIASRLVPGPADPGSVSTALSYVNNLYVRGYHTTRKFLLGILLNWEYTMGNKCYRVGDYLPVTFDGDRGTLMSPMPTNFNCRKKFDRTTFQTKVQKVVFHQRPTKATKRSEESDRASTLLYVEWLIRHQPDEEVDQLVSSERQLDIIEAFNDIEHKLPIGFTMVPTVRWVPFDHDNSLVI